MHISKQNDYTKIILPKLEENDEINKLRIKLTQMENEKKQIELEKNKIENEKNKILDEKNKIQNENTKIKQMMEDINKDSLSSIQTSRLSKDSKDELIFSSCTFNQIEGESLSDDYKFYSLENQSVFSRSSNENNIYKNFAGSHRVINLNDNRFK